MSIATDIVDIACQTKPNQVTLVPEKREEVTTEGGLDLVGNFDNIRATVERLQEAGISVSLFLDPESAQIEAAQSLQVDAIELHTGQYAPNGWRSTTRLPSRINSGWQTNRQQWHYTSCWPRIELPKRHTSCGINDMLELNIGHSIIARGTFL